MRRIFLISSLSGYNMNSANRVLRELWVNAGGVPDFSHIQSLPQYSRIVIKSIDSGDKDTNKNRKKLFF